MNNKNKNLNVPNLRFSYEDEWIDNVFSSVVILRKEKYDPAKENVNYPCIELECLNQNTGELLTTFNSLDQKSIKNKFYENDVLFGKLRPYLKKYYYSRFKGVCTSEIWVLTSNVINTKFLYQYIQTKNFLDLTNISTGSKMPRADWSIISDSIFYYPKEYEEMKKIADFLYLIDERIRLQNKIIKDLERQREYIIQKIFRKIDNNKKIQLIDVVEEYSQRTESNNQFPVLSSTASGIYLQNEYFNKDTSSDDTTGYKIIPRGYCTYRSMSDTGVFNFNQQNLVDFGIVSPAYPVFHSVRYDEAFVVLYLNKSQNIKKQISQLKTGGTRFALSFKSLCNLSIPDISKEKQQSIMKMIDAFDEKINNEKQIQANMTVQKQYLLNNMFI